MAFRTLTLNYSGSRRWQNIKGLKAKLISSQNNCHFSPDAATLRSKWRNSHRYEENGVLGTNGPIPMATGALNEKLQGRGPLHPLARPLPRGQEKWPPPCPSCSLGNGRTSKMPAPVSHTKWASSGRLGYYKAKILDLFYYLDVTTQATIFSQIAALVLVSEKIAGFFRKVWPKGAWLAAFGRGHLQMTRLATSFIGQGWEEWYLVIERYCPRLSEGMLAIYLESYPDLWPLFTIIPRSSSATLTQIIRRW